MKLSAFILSLGMLFSTAALAQEIPAPTPNGIPPGFCPNVVDAETFVKVIKEKYNEVPAEIGIASKDGSRAMMLFESEGGKSWTLTALTNDGKICIMAAGSDWVDLKETPAPAPEKQHEGFNFNPDDQEVENFNG